MSAATAQPVAPQTQAIPGMDGQGANVSRDPVSKHSTDPVLSAYIREVSRVALLSRDEEVLLFTTLYEARATVFSVLDRLRDLLSADQTKLLNASTLRYEEMQAVWQNISARARALLTTRQTAELMSAFATW